MFDEDVLWYTRHLLAEQKLAVLQLRGVMNDEGSMELQPGMSGGGEVGKCPMYMVPTNIILKNGQRLHLDFSMQ